MNAFLQKGAHEMSCHGCHNIFLVPCAKFHCRYFARIFSTLSHVQVLSRTIAFEGYARPLPHALALLHMNPRHADVRDACRMFLLDVPNPRTFEMVRIMMVAAGYRKCYAVDNALSAAMKAIFAEVDVRTEATMAVLLPARLENKWFHSHVIPYAKAILVCTGNLHRCRRRLSGSRTCRHDPRAKTNPCGRVPWWQCLTRTANGCRSSRATRGCRATACPLKAFPYMQYKTLRYDGFVRLCSAMEEAMVCDVCLEQYQDNGPRGSTDPLVHRVCAGRNPGGPAVWSHVLPQVRPTGSVPGTNPAGNPSSPLSIANAAHRRSPVPPVASFFFLQTSPAGYCVRFVGFCSRRSQSYAMACSPET
jgi:hypothetical protein